MSQLLLNNLGVICPSCDELNAQGTAKCASCGTDLYGSPQPARAPARPAAQATPSRPLPVVAAPAASPTPRTPSQPVPATVPSPRTPAHPVPAVSPSPRTPAQPVPAMSATARTAPHPALRASGPKIQPPGLASRPAGRPPPPPPESQAIPAGELARRPTAHPTKFSLAALAGAQRGQRVRLSQSCQIGRSRGQIIFADDPYLSALHATLVVRDGRLYVKDESSASGTFVSVPGQEQIQQNAHFAAGGRLFRFMGLLTPPTSLRPGTVMIYGAPLPPGHVVYGVEEILVGNRGGRAVVTGGALLTIGASKCDLTYPADEGLASRHCELSPTPAGALLRDLSGGLGTFLRLGTAERALGAGDKIRIGNQILQVEV